MSRFETITNISNKPELKEIYQDITSNGFGFNSPMSYFTILANRPDLLNSTWQLLKSVIVNGKLPSTLKQLISYAISYHNDCEFCSTAHSNALETLGVPKNIVSDTVKDLENLSPMYRDIVKFSVKASKDPKSITDDDYNLLKENGLDQEETLELVMLISLTNFSNTYADLAQIPLEFG